MHGQGIAKQLFMNLLSNEYICTFSFIQLEVEINNYAAIALYNSFGFQMTSTTLNKLIMKLYL